jgi:hypothetical protein
VVSEIAVPPDDLDQGVGKALGEGKTVHSTGKHREIVLGIGITGRLGQAAVGSARRAQGGVSGIASLRGQVTQRQRANLLTETGTIRASRAPADVDGTAAH